MRKALIIIATIIVLAGVGVAVYFYFFNNTPTITVGPPTNNTNLPTSQSVAPAATTSPPISQPSQSVTARLVKVSAGPVVLGEAVITVPAENASSSPHSLVTYILRESGNVYSYNTASGASTRTSNKTLPGIQSAAWLPDASTAFVRYLSGTDLSAINTYALPSNGSEGFFLPQNISDLAVSSTSVLTLASGVNGSVASLARKDGTHAAEIFTTPLSSLKTSFAGGKQYLAYTKPSATLPGAAFLVDTAGHFSRIAGPHSGLVAKASPSGKWVLVSYVRNGTLQMELVDTTSGEILPLPIATIADKCVWTANDAALYCGIPTTVSANAAYPDDWYQGAVSFSDRIWKIQVSGRYAQLVLDFTKETEVSLDAEALAIDPSSLTLVFVNKNDESLWSYAL